MELKPAITENKNATCERCGHFGALEIAGQFLCADCVAVAGCGCAGDHDAESNTVTV